MSLLLQNVVDEFSKLPGIGRRTAMRLALHLLKMEEYSVEDMSRSMEQFRKNIQRCDVCFNLSDTAVCPICNNYDRDRTTVCVVEQIGDLMSIEATRQYRGLYHVLGGVISPMGGVAPSDLKIKELVERVGRGEIKEVILAISTSIEGETTLFYISNALRNIPNIKLTNISRGVGVGDELEYVDELTIAHALQNRREL